MFGAAPSYRKLVKCMRVFFPWKWKPGQQPTRSLRIVVSTRDCWLAFLQVPFRRDCLSVPKPTIEASAKFSGVRSLSKKQVFVTADDEQGVIESSSSLAGSRNRPAHLLKMFNKVFPGFVFCICDAEFISKEQCTLGEKTIQVSSIIVLTTRVRKI